jgi:hypothetical protein
MLSQRRTLLLTMSLIGASANAQIADFRALLSPIDQNIRLRALHSKSEQANLLAHASLGALLPRAHIEGSAQHLNDDLVLDLDPLRQALIQLQSRDALSDAKLSAAIQGQTLSPAQEQAVLQSATAQYQQGIPPFREVVKEQNHWTGALVIVQPLWAGGRLWTARKAALSKRELQPPKLDKSNWIYNAR